MSLTLGLGIAPLFAQKKERDSLLRLIEQELPKAQEAKTLRRLAELLTESDPARAGKMALEALALSEALGDSLEMVRVRKTLGNIYWIYNDYDRSLEYGLASLQIAERMQDSQLLSSIYTQLANNYADLNYYDKTFEYRLKAFRIDTASRIATQMIPSYINLGDDYRVVKNFDKAVFYTQEALRLSQEQQLVPNIGFCLMNLAEIYFDLQQYPKALEYAESAYQILKDTEETFYQLYILTDLGKIYRLIGRYEASEKYLLEGLVVAARAGSKQLFRDLYYELAQTREARQNYQEALKAFQLAKVYEDSIFNDAKLQQIAIAQARYDLASKQSEIEALRSSEAESQARMRTQRNNNFLLLVGLSITLLLLLALYRSFRQKRKINEELLFKNQQIETQRAFLKNQNQELEQKNEELLLLDKEKSYLLNIVAHDLRNPVNQIKGFLNLLRMTTQNFSEEQYEYISMAQHAAARLTSMINNILDINAIEKQGLQLNLESVDVPEIMASVVQSFRSKAHAKHIEIHFDIANQVQGALVALDKNATLQIFENLISNAIKFSFQNGQIYVRLLDRADKLRIEIQDEGPGISPEDQEKLFGKFQKLSARPTAGEQSIGLGLSIVKTYVEAMGGRVWCESVLNEGANFIVEFDKVQQA